MGAAGGSYEWTSVTQNCTLNLLYFSKQTLISILVLFNKILTFIKRRIEGLFRMVEKASFLKQSEKKSKEVNWKHELILFKIVCKLGRKVRI